MGMESDPITIAIRDRALEAARMLIPPCDGIVRDLTSSRYREAITSLAELREHLDHTRTLISILLDWQTATEKAPHEKPAPEPPHEGGEEGHG